MISNYRAKLNIIFDIIMKFEVNRGLSLSGGISSKSMKFGSITGRFE